MVHFLNGNGVISTAGSLLRDSIGSILYVLNLH